LKIKKITSLVFASATQHACKVTRFKGQIHGHKSRGTRGRVPQNLEWGWDTNANRLQILCFKISSTRLCLQRNNIGQVVHTYVPLSPSSMTWYQPRGGDALKVTAGLAESNGSLPPCGRLIVNCGLTACTPGSAPGPTLGNEHEKHLPLP